MLSLYQYSSITNTQMLRVGKPETHTLETSSTYNAARHYFEMLPSMCYVELVVFMLISMNVDMLDLT